MASNTPRCREIAIGDLSAYERWTQQTRSAPTPARVVLATRRSSTANLIACQLEPLRRLEPTRVVVHLGPADIIDGFDESYVHARIVELCDTLRDLTSAHVTLVGIPPVTDADAGLAEVIRQCNAAAACTAQLRGFAWEPFER